MLWGFNFTKKLNKDGSEVPVTEKMVPGFFSVPERFKCDIKARSPAHAKVMRSEWEKAEADGLDF